MAFSDLLRMAAGAVRRHRLRTILSVLGVVIGVASVILLTSLGEGARTYVIEEFASLGTNILIVLPGKTETTGTMPAFGGTPRDITLEDVDALRKRLPYMRTLAPLVFGTATARYGERSREIRVVGTTSELLRVRNLTIAIGRYLPEADIERGRQVCVIGPRVQQELFGAESPLGEILRVGDERYRIIGVTAPRGMSLGIDLDDVAHIPIPDALRLFNQNGIFRLLISGNSPGDLNALKRLALAVMKDRHDGVEDVTAITQDSVVSALGRILTILTAALAGIAAISLSVAGIGIMNVMLVSVSERTREIGLMKAIGASPLQVMAIFLAEAALLSSFGGLLGIGTAYALTRLLGALYPSFPVEMPGWSVSAAVLVSLAVGMLFGALPARRAARLDPVAALSRR